MNNAQLNELKNKYVANGAASPATHFADRAENSVIWDVAAVQAQVANLMHTCQIVIPYAG